MKIYFKLLSSTQEACIKSPFLPKTTKEISWFFSIYWHRVLFASEVFLSSSNTTETPTKNLSKKSASSPLPCLQKTIYKNLTTFYTAGSTSEKIKNKEKYCPSKFPNSFTLEKSCLWHRKSRSGSKETQRQSMN